ncbi:MAG: 1-acyl-sn-glycerol-3-phosphate acyltransferase [Bacteroidota bacterium]
MNPEPYDFEEIRPYTDEEVPEVMKRLTSKTSLFVMMGVFFPELTPEEIQQKFTQVNSTSELQEKYIAEAIRRMISASAGQLTVSGLAEIDAAKTHLFISNHRDIILDPGIFNEQRHRLKLPTTLIAIGDNLLVTSLVTDLMKLNKSFIVHRSLPRNQLFPYSQRLSNYIRTSLLKESESVWIAQKSGRTKDGNDETQTALLKMLALSGSQDLVQGFLDLNIIPMAISYEYEPCDMLKTAEIVATRNGELYNKSDKMAIIRGIRDYKGRIDMTIGASLSMADYESLGDAAKRNDWFKNFKQLLDHKIQSLYQLWPTHYIAADIQAGDNNYAEHYTPSEKDAFLQHLEKRLKEVEGPEDQLREQFIAMYARPVQNRYT